ncbi:hypothetical protein [Pelagibacterium sp.]|uniref:hypothetical protein n=1 Tax=Pelagibacterium sp. TaxID=1967288 RepID=UPI003A8CB606
MKKLSALALGTALTLSMPLTALAQDADAGVTLDGGVATELGGEDSGVDTGVELGVDTGVATEGSSDMSVDVGANADAAVSSYTYGDLDDAIHGAGTAELSGVTADTEIEIVEISDLGEDGDLNAEAFADSRADFQSDVDLLQSSISENADLVSALEAEGYTHDEVVAVWTQADGALTVFVDSQNSAEAEAAEDAGLTDDAMGSDTSAKGEAETNVSTEGEVTAQ